MEELRDWRFNGSLEIYKERVGKAGLAEYAAILERLKAAGKLSRPLWPDKYNVTVT